MLSWCMRLFSFAWMLEALSSFSLQQAGLGSSETYVASQPI